MIEESIKCKVCGGYFTYKGGYSSTTYRDAQVCGKTCYERVSKRERAPINCKLIRCPSTNELCPTQTACQVICQKQAETDFIRRTAHSRCAVCDTAFDISHFEDTAFCTEHCKDIWLDRQGRRGVIRCEVCNVHIPGTNGIPVCSNIECQREMDKRKATHQGLRYNTDKTRWSLVPSEVISVLADHYTVGAKKYADNNWRKGLSFNDTYDCAMRHIHLWKMGEEIDAETGSRHLIAAIWNLVALVYFCMYPARYGKFDDRVDNEAHAIYFDESTVWTDEQAKMAQAIAGSVGYPANRRNFHLLTVDRRKQDNGRPGAINRRQATEDRRKI